VPRSARCKKAAPPVVYQAVPVETRDIVVSAQAAGQFSRTPPWR
jgi:hypothetical protein